MASSESKAVLRHLDYCLIWSIRLAHTVIMHCATIHQQRINMQILGDA